MPPQNDCCEAQLITDHRYQHQHHLNQKQHNQSHKHTIVSIKMSKNELIFNNENGEGKVDHTNWGFPGYLTEEEYIVYEKFREEVLSRKQEVRDTVFSFQSANEIEAYALCRWLRARKFNLQDTIKMVEEATECTSIPRENDFYPSQSLALGCDSTYYIKQYPQVYYGHARNGCPVFYSKPAVMDINAIESITSIPNIISMHWNSQMHELVTKLKDQYEASNGEFKRYACVCILDLKNLTPAQLTKRALKITKEQSAIDSLCFPETLSHLAIINAPGFFALTWKLIKSWIDERTASKVSVIGSKGSTLTKHLSKIIDIDSLPVDYGGNGKSIDEVLHEDMVHQHNIDSRMSGAALGAANKKKEDGFELKLENKETCLIALRGEATHEINVMKDRLVKVTVFTRSLYGGILTIKDQSGSMLSSLPKEGIHIRHMGETENDEDELPTKYDFEEKYGVVFEGQGKFQIDLKSFGSKYKTAYILIGTTEFSKATPAPQTPVIQHKKKETYQVGAGDSSVLLSSRSICSGMFPGENAEDSIILMRPSPIIRKEKKVFMSTITGVNAYYETPSPPKVKKTVKDSRISLSGCGEFPLTLSKYLE